MFAFFGAIIFLIAAIPSPDYPDCFEDEVLVTIRSWDGERHSKPRETAGVEQDVAA